MAKRKYKSAPHSGDTGAVEGIRGFMGIPRCVIESAAYRHLELIDRAILVEIVNRMTGANNGAIHISYAELATALNRKNQAAIGPSIARLMTHGLVALAEEAIWQERRAREYRLTFVNTTDSIGRPIKATNDYLSWRPGEKIDTTDAVAEKPKSVTPFVAEKIRAATDAVAGTTGNCGFSPSPSATDGVVPILLPSAGREKIGAEQSEIANGLDEGREALIAARARITGHWQKLKTAARRRAWAADHGLTADDVQMFITADSGSLPFPKVAALVASARAAA